MNRPLVVIEGKQEATTSLLATFGAAGWVVHRGFHVPIDDWSVSGIVCAGTVASLSDAALAVLAAVRGAGLVVALSARDEVREQLVEDLEKVGPVDYWPKHGSSPLARLTLDQWCLLELLAEGRTLGYAANLLHFSSRTADRQVAAARAALGAKSTAEAVMIVRSFAESSGGDDQLSA